MYLLRVLNGADCARSKSVPELVDRAILEVDEDPNETDDGHDSVVCWSHQDLRLNFFIGSVRQVPGWAGVDTDAVLWLAQHCKGQLLLFLLRCPPRLGALKFVALACWKPEQQHFCPHGLAWLRARAKEQGVREQGSPDLVWFLLRCKPLVNAIGRLAFNSRLLRYGLTAATKALSLPLTSPLIHVLLAGSEGSQLSATDVHNIVKVVKASSSITETETLDLLHELKFLGPPAGFVIEFIGSEQ
jgi:hypothetical protein